MSTLSSPPRIDPPSMPGPLWPWLSVAVLVRLVVAAFHLAPCHPDAAYSLSVARSMVEGRGAVDGFVLWNAIEPLLHTVALPPNRAANSFWLPLPQWLAFPGLWLGQHLSLSPEQTHILAALPSGLTAAMFPVVALILSQRSNMRDLRRARLVGAIAFVVALFPARATFLSGAVDTMAPAGALFWMGVLLVERGPSHRFHSLAAGLLVGFACLARGELLWVSVLYCAFRWWPPFASKGEKPRSFSLRKVEWLLGPLLVSLLFSLHLWSTFGRWAPASGQAFWLREYEELFAWNHPLSFETLLDSGSSRRALPSHVLALLGTRLSALVQVPIVTSLQLSGPLALLALLGLHRVREKLDTVARASALAILLVFAMLALAFPLAALHGTAFHDGGVLLPVLALLVAHGVVALLPPAMWRVAPERARSLDASVVLVLAALLGAFAWSTSEADRAAATRTADEHALAGWLRSHAPEVHGGILTMHAAQLHWDTGLVTYQLPSNGLDAALAVTRERSLGLWVIPSVHPAAVQEVYAIEEGVLAQLSFQRVIELHDGTRIVRFVER